MSAKTSGVSTMTSHKPAPDSKNHEVAEEYLRQVGGSLGFPLNSMVMNSAIVARYKLVGTRWAGAHGGMKLRPI